MSAGVPTYGLLDAQISGDLMDCTMDDCSFHGEDKDYSDKWQQLGDEKNIQPSPGVTHSSHHGHLNYHQQCNTNLFNHNSPTQYHVPDEVSLDSQGNPEGSKNPSASTGSASIKFPEPAASKKETASFLFVGPLGKKRKYSRQRAVSDDNESESHLQIATGSPETTEEEMDQSQSPSLGDNSQSTLDNQHPKSSLAQEEPAGEIKDSGLRMAGGEPVSTIISPPRTQRSSPESGGDSAGETTNTTTATSGGTGGHSSIIISKPLPITGAPTSVIRRVSRKKQEHPLPLNLSVSSPPGSSNSNFPSSPDSSNLAPSASPTGRLTRVSDGHSVCPTSSPSVIRDELYFDGRTQGDRQVFVWRYRDDVPVQTPLTTVAGPMSPCLSNVSATSFVVPDVTGSKIGSSGESSSASSVVSHLPPGSHDQSSKANEDTSGTGSNASAKPPKKKLRCGDCGKEFSQLRNYRYHRSRHEGSDQFSCTCPVCGKQFNDRGYLSSHMKIHRNAKEYRCEYCTKGFNQRVAYNMHRRIHTGHRPHQCEVCGKSFSRRMLLKQHMRIHTGERPYSCGVCNKAFADRSNMLLHQRLHSGERPYVCEICKKSFSKNHHLKTHMNHHAGIKPYECPKCHARFSQSSNMKTHLKKCSGIPNPTTSQRHQMLRRNPLDVSRSTSQLPSLPPLPGVVAVAAAAAAGNAGIRSKETLPPLSGPSRLIYDQQSLSILTQSITGQGVVAGQSAAPQLSPAQHSRGQVPIESLLLHLNVGRNRHPSQGSVHSAPPTSPTSTVSLSDFQLMLRNAAAAASSGSRPVSVASNHGLRVYSSSSTASSSTAIPSASVASGGMNSIPGMGSFGGMVLSPTSVTNTRYSPPGGGNTNESVPPPALSPMMSINPNLGLSGYGMDSTSRGSSESAVMPPPQSSASVLRNVPTPSTYIHPDMLPASPANILRVDTRSIDGFQSMSMISPPTDRSGNRPGRVVTNPMVSPRRKQPSPSSLSASGSFIPLSTLETAAIASGLRSPSQMVRFLSSALRDAEGPLTPNRHSSSTRLPSLQHQNVLEAMVAAANAEQNASISSPASGGTGTTRIRHVPSSHHPHPSQSHSPFQYSGESNALPSLHLSHSATITSGEPQHSTLGSSIQSQQIIASTPPYSVITSSHILHQIDHQQQHQLNIQQRSGVNYSRFATPSSSVASRSSSGIDDHHASLSDQKQHIELQHQQQPTTTQPPRHHGYHQTLLQSRVNQGTVPLSPGYSSSNSTNSSNSGYSSFNHSIISRSRSHSPGIVEHIRERNPNYQNQ